MSGLLKSSTGKLYTLLSACVPENEAVYRRCLLAEIMDDSQYELLASSDAGKYLYEKYYSPEILPYCPTYVLLEIKKILDVINDYVKAVCDTVSLLVFEM